jgi:hypothetical protein
MSRNYSPGAPSTVRRAPTMLSTFDIACEITVVPHAPALQRAPSRSVRRDHDAAETKPSQGSAVLTTTDRHRVVPTCRDCDRRLGQGDTACERRPHRQTDAVHHPSPHAQTRHTKDTADTLAHQHTTRHTRRCAMREIQAEAHRLKRHANYASSWRRRSFASI